MVDALGHTKDVFDFSRSSSATTFKYIFFEKHLKVSDALIPSCNPD